MKNYLHIKDPGKSLETHFFIFVHTLLLHDGVHVCENIYDDKAYDSLVVFSPIQMVIEVELQCVG